MKKRRCLCLVVVNANTVTLVGAPRRAAQGTAGGPIPEAVLASQPKRSAVRRAAPSRRDRAILVLAGVLRKGARPLRALPPFGRPCPAPKSLRPTSPYLHSRPLSEIRHTGLRRATVSGDAWNGVRSLDCRLWVYRGSFTLQGKAQGLIKVCPMSFSFSSVPS